MPLFAKDDLAAYLQLQVTPPSEDGTQADPAGLVDDATYTVIEKIVDGWLSYATGMDAWPDPIPKQLFSWAVELGAIAYENPAAAQSDNTGRVGMSWNEKRRTAILEAAAGWARDLPAQALIPSPSGSFPRPDRMPHALRRAGGRDRPWWYR